MTFDLLDLPLLFGCLVGLALIVRYLSRDEGQFMGRIAFVSVLGIGVWQLFVFALIFSGNIVKFPHLWLTGFPMEFLVGPLIFLYSESAFRRRKAFNWKDLLHLVPYLGAVYAMRGLYGLGVERKVEIFANMDTRVGPLSTFWLILFVSILLSKAGYFVVFIRNLRGFEREISNVTADSSLIDDLFRYRRFSLMFLGYICLFLGLVVYLSFSHLYGMYADYIWYVLKSAWLFAFAFFSIRSGSRLLDFKPVEEESGLIEVIDAAPEVSVKQPSTGRKYAKSGLPEVRVEQIKKRLLACMQREKLYLENELNLTTIAERLKLHPNHISQVINQGLDSSFSDFVNGYRIEYAKELLADNGSVSFSSLVDVGFESGFNSRASFNRVFKKFTDMTPSQYREKSLDFESTLVDKKVYHIAGKRNLPEE